MLPGIFSIWRADEWYWIVFNSLLLITIISVVVVIVLENRDPVKTVSWLLVLFLLPAIGIILYLYIGRNFRRNKFFTIKGVSDEISLEQLRFDQLHQLNENTLVLDERIKQKSNLMRLLLNNSKSILTDKNIVRVLNNGRQTFGSIIYELENARHHIHLEFFIIEDDTIGNKIKDILIRKSQEGVKVRVIYDDVGSWFLSKRYLRELKDAGIETGSFMPIRFYRLANKVNYRLHRKIIVIDGRVGFVGGINIADRYWRGLGKNNMWRDTHLRLEGESVNSLQAVFIMDWHFVKEEQIDIEGYFPETNIRERRFVQIVTSGPDSDYQSIMQAYFTAITTARKYVYLSTPYFMPNESILTALRTAALSGIDVRILLPEKNDSWIVGNGSRSYLSEILETGVKVYLFRKGFTHSKLMIVDDVFSSVGTANMDIRSFSEDFEVNALIYDEEVTLSLKKDFLIDIEASLELSIDEWIKRPLKYRWLESLARLFSPLM
jgi:cardiolipin synthase